MPNKSFFTSPGFLIADLWSGLRAGIQKEMPIVNFVNVLSCQTWVEKHYAAILMEETQEKVRRS